MVKYIDWQTCEAALDELQTDIWEKAPLSFRGVLQLSLNKEGEDPPVEAVLSLRKRSLDRVFTAEEAAELAEYIKLGAEMAKNFKYNGYLYSWSVRNTEED